MIAKLNEEHLRIVISVDEQELVDLWMALEIYSSEILKRGYPNQAKKIHEMATLLVGLESDLIDAKTERSEFYADTHQERHS